MRARDSVVEPADRPEVIGDPRHDRLGRRPHVELRVELSRCPFERCVVFPIFERYTGRKATPARLGGRCSPSGGRERTSPQALDYLREPDIAAEYLRAFGGENVHRFLGRYRPHPRAHR
jgi:hypothetical protein